MKKVLFVLLSVCAMTAAAQEIEVCDSIDLETGVIYPASCVSAEVVDTISCEELVGEKTAVPQVPFSELDSLTMSNLDDRYVVAWKGGKCGIYDIVKEENVTNIEYKELWFSFRKEMEGEYYTYFGWDEVDKKGVIGIAEQTNEYIGISFPKKQEEDRKE